MTWGEKVALALGLYLGAVCLGLLIAERVFGAEVER